MSSVPIQPKPHRPVYQAIVNCLEQIFSQGYYADKVLEREFKKHREWGSRDRRFIAETVYDLVRWWRFLWAVLNEDPSTEQSSLWRLLGAILLLEKKNLPDWPEFKNLSSNLIYAQRERARLVPAIRESIPDWLEEQGLSELGERWPGYMHALNKAAPVFLRANRLKISVEDLRASLQAEGFASSLVEGLPDALKLLERKNVFSSQAFHKGQFEVQDGASQSVAPMLELKSGMRLIDACAGAGGKSLHAASLMQNKGKILALDTQEKKLAELRKRSTRNGVDIIEVKTIDSSKVIKRLAKTADRVLLDVPCTGLGVLRRNPDTKWKLSPERVAELARIQTEILDQYSEMTKVDGILVYSTCSILPSENEDQVRTFLDRQPGKWQIVNEKKFAPDEHGFDGFYAVSLKRLKD